MKWKQTQIDPETYILGNEDAVVSELKKGEWTWEITCHPVHGRVVGQKPSRQEAMVIAEGFMWKQL
jgi:hypothetical protein